VNSISGKFQNNNGKVDVGLNLNVSSTGFTSISGQVLTGVSASTIEIEIKNMDSSKMIIA
jgi:hypothetical protein